MRSTQPKLLILGATIGGSPIFSEGAEITLKGYTIVYPYTKYYQIWKSDAKSIRAASLSKAFLSVKYSESHYSPTYVFTAIRFSYG
jgi:hypothetical protein